MTERTDILVAGGGLAGMLAALGFDAAGFRVTLVDPAQPTGAPVGPDADPRTTAFLQPAQAFLAELGVWADVADQSAALRIMRIVDAESGRIRADSRFDAGEISDQPFGWNVANWRLRNALGARLTASGVDLRPGAGVTDVLSRRDEAIVSLTDRSRVRARMVVAADGRDSRVRQAAGIPVRVIRYGQKALVFRVSHAAPHNETSVEVHDTGGPFTLVPLPAAGGANRSAVVWMTTGPEARHLAALDDDAFQDEANNRSAGVLGPLKVEGPRSVWPIRSQIARTLTAERIALVAEAAHVVPPIGAQGLNMSLSDIKTLRDLAADRPDGLGDARMLDAYQRARKPHIAARVAAIDVLNRASMTRAPLLRDLRAEGIRLIHRTRPVRTGLMRAGLRP